MRDKIRSEYAPSSTITLDKLSAATEQRAEPEEAHEAASNTVPSGKERREKQRERQLPIPFVNDEALVRLAVFDRNTGAERNRIEKDVADLVIANAEGW